MTERNTARRLSKAVTVLKVIDFRRHTEGDPGIGSNIERTIINYELRSLEEEIARNPGVLAEQLDTDVVRVRRR